MIHAALCTLIVFGFAGCADSLTYTEGTLDSPAIIDPSLNDPTYLVSKRTNLNLDIPVIVAAHGFTASTAEWDDFLTYVGGKEPTLNPASGVYLSVVLLGGHGQSIDEFRNATWKDWGRPIVEEYERLVALGFKHISIAGASTGGALILKHLNDFVFSQPPHHIFLVDSLVVTQSKMLYAVPHIYFMVSDGKRENMTEGEKTRWYSISPKEALLELADLSNKLKYDLSRGISLPHGTKCSIYQAKNDDVVDPISALMIRKGLRQSDGEKPSFLAVDSDKHVFISLKYRETVTNQDTLNQQNVFSDILQKAKSIK